MRFACGAALRRCTQMTARVEVILHHLSSLRQGRKSPKQIH